VDVLKLWLYSDTSGSNIFDLSSTATVTLSIETHHVRKPANLTIFAEVSTDAQFNCHYMLDGYVSAKVELGVVTQFHRKISLYSAVGAIFNAEVSVGTEQTAYIPAQNTGNVRAVSYIGGFDLYTLRDDELQSLTCEHDYQPTPYFNQLVEEIHAAIPELWDEFLWDQSSWDVGGIAYLPNQADADMTKWRQLDTVMMPFIYKQQNRIRDISISLTIANANVDIYGLAYTSPEELSA
jgi:hypothetical protein